MNFKEYLMDIDNLTEKKLTTYKIIWFIPSESNSGSVYTTFLEGFSQQEVQKEFKNSDRMWVLGKNNKKKLVHFGGENPVITSITPINLKK